MAGWPCMCDWLASLCGIVQTIQTSRLQIVPCSRVLRQLATLVPVANVPNPHVIILQKHGPAFRDVGASTAVWHTFMTFYVLFLTCSVLTRFEGFRVSKDIVRTVTDHIWKELQLAAPDVQQA